MAAWWVWHYRRADPEQASLRARELLDDLAGYNTGKPRSEAVQFEVTLPQPEQGTNLVCTNAMRRSSDLAYSTVH